MSNKTTGTAVLFPCLLGLALTVPLFAQPPGAVQKQERAAVKSGTKPDSTSQPAFRIDQPGTITFTVGMVIKGKIEKPQVIIFLPKEKSYYRDLEFTHSFAGDISNPLPFVPILE